MARGGGGLFMKLAPELLLVFLNYLYLHDIAKLRCVSRWFDERICSIMPSKCRRFKLRFNGKTEFSWKSILSMYCDNNYECILKAMRKPNGHLNLLDVTVDGRCKKFNTIQKVLNDNKDNIAALHILPGHLPTDFTSFLQHESTRFKFLEKLTICKYENSNLGNLLTKHAEQLTYLRLSNFYPFYTSLPNLPKSPKLKTVVAIRIRPESLVSLLSSCSESLSKLSLKSPIVENHLNINISHEQLPELPNLQTLSLFDIFFPEIVASLISKCRPMLTGINFDGCFIRPHQVHLIMENFPQVKCLRFRNVHEVLANALIASNASQLETLILVANENKYEYQNRNWSFPDLLPKLKNVWMNKYWVLPNLLKSAPVLLCLVIDDGSHVQSILKMPNLTDLYLIEFYCNQYLFDEESRPIWFANISDTLEFLVYKGDRYETEEIETSLTQLKKVHTVIVLNNYSSESDHKRELDFFRSLCPNAQILTTYHGREYIVETLKLRLKYLKAHDIFIEQLGSSLELDGIYCNTNTLFKNF